MEAARGQKHPSDAENGMKDRSGKMKFFCFQIQNAWHQTFLLT